MLITQNIDGLDGKAGNKDYISIHGRLDKVVYYDDEMKYQVPFDAEWNEINIEDSLDNIILKNKLLKKFNIQLINNIPAPKRGKSLKPYVLLFDEMYTDLYRITEAENWMKNASKIIFMGTSFSVNITSIALRIAISRGIDVDIVDPEPIKLDYENIEYFNMTAVEYCNMRNLKT